MEKQITLTLDEETARRLEALSDNCHSCLESVAASLLHDVLKDDEDAHFLLGAPAASPMIN